jgi:hypothetical protein
MKTAPTNRTCIRSTIARKLRGDRLAAKEEPPNVRSGPSVEEPQDKIEL